MKTTTKTRRRFAVCINNEGYEASLEAGKLYRVIVDPKAERHGYLRIVDESGEDYGYATDRFFPIDVPRPLERALVKGPRHDDAPNHALHPTPPASLARRSRRG